MRHRIWKVFLTSNFTVDQTSAEASRMLLVGTFQAVHEMPPVALPPRPVTPFRLNDLAGGRRGAVFRAGQWACWDQDFELPAPVERTIGLIRTPDNPVVGLHLRPGMIWQRGFHRLPASFAHAPPTTSLIFSRGNTSRRALLELYAPGSSGVLIRCSSNPAWCWLALGVEAYGGALNAAAWDYGGALPTVRQGADHGAYCADPVVFTFARMAHVVW